MKRKMHRLLMMVNMLAMGLSLAGQAQSPRKIKIMPMGNSITSGFGLTGAISYRYYLWKKLERSGWAPRVDFVGRVCGGGFEPEPPHCGFPAYPQSEWDWDSESHPGMATPYFVSIMSNIIGAEIPDIVLMHLGTNDIIQNLPLENTKNNISNIIDRFREANPRVIILLAKLIPLPMAPASLEYLNSLIAVVAAEKNTPVSPVILVDHYSTWNNSTDFRLDNIHPNDRGEQKMANTWYAYLLPVLQAMSELSVRIVCPIANAVVELNKPTVLKAVSRAMTGVASLCFMGNGTMLGFGSRINDSTFALQWVPLVSGPCELRAIVVDSLGQYDTSAVVVVTVTENSPAVDVPVSAIQDTGTVSPFVSQRVRTSGVVTCIARDSLRFWIQDPIGDGFVATSDGIAVVLNDGQASLCPSVGDLIEIVACVEEYAEKPGDPTITRLTHVDSIRIVSSNNPLPSPVLVSSLPSAVADMPLISAAYRRAEGMLVKFTNARIVAALDDQGMFGLLPEQNLTSGRHPDVAVVLPDTNGEVNYRAQVVAIGTCALRTVPVARSGATVTAITGVVDYRCGTYVVEALAESLHISPVQAISTPLSMRSSPHGSLSIATFNLGGFFDTLDAYGKSDPVITSAAYFVRMEKCCRAVIEEFRLPGILALQRVENNAILADLAARVNAISGRGYAAVSFDTDDPQGLECGFLYDTLIFGLVQAHLMAGSAIDSSFGHLAPVRGRQPLVGIFSSAGVWVAVVNIDFIDRPVHETLLFSPSWPSERPSESLRLKQAQAVRRWVNIALQQYRDARIIIAGSVNDFPFSEANEVIDPVSVLKGTAALGETIFASAYDALPVEDRYTATSWMRGVMFNHLLISPALLPLVRGVDVLRIHTPFETQLADDPTTAACCGSSDGLEVRF